MNEATWTLAGYDETRMGVLNPEPPLMPEEYANDPGVHWCLMGIEPVGPGVLLCKWELYDDGTWYEQLREARATLEWVYSRLMDLFPERVEEARSGCNMVQGVIVRILWDPEQCNVMQKYVPQHLRKYVEPKSGE